MDIFDIISGISWTTRRRRRKLGIFRSTCRSYLNGVCNISLFIRHLIYSVFCDVINRNIQESTREGIDLPILTSDFDIRFWHPPVVSLLHLHHFFFFFLLRLFSDVINIKTKSWRGDWITNHRRNRFINKRVVWYPTFYLCIAYLALKIYHKA